MRIVKLCTYKGRYSSNILIPKHMDFLLCIVFYEINKLEIRGASIGSWLRAQAQKPDCWGSKLALLLIICDLEKVP